MKPITKLTRSDMDLRGVIENSAGGISICFFNNKGGVGKTTLCANFAAELALNFEAKVLVIDADPQCNLTQYVLPEEDVNVIYSQQDPETIFSIIRPLRSGKGYEIELPTRKSEKFGVDIIIGDPRLALEEDLLAQDWRDARSGGIRGIRTTFVFAELVKNAREKGYDFIIFDIGPSLGAINRSVLLSVDAFIVPMNIDVFSVWSLRNIGQTVATWKKSLDIGLSMAEEPSEVRELAPRGKLRFIGYVTQQHKERTGYDKIDGEDGPTKVKRKVKAYEAVGEKIPREIEHYFKGLYASPDITPHLGDVKHLGGLIQRSQLASEPLLTVSGPGTASRGQAREIYRGLVRALIKNLQAAKLFGA